MIRMLFVFKVVQIALGIQCGHTACTDYLSHHGMAVPDDEYSRSIGDNILIGPAVQIYTATHPIDAQERFQPSDDDPELMQYTTRALPVRIGSNVWLGGGAILMPGIQIGDNSTIGAGAVVTEPIPPDVFAAGNPCRIIRELK